MAFLSSALTLSTPALLSILVGLLLFWFARNRYKPGLRSIPGPFLASISDLWYFVHCCRRRHTREWEIHQRYRSTLVRVGPNMVSCSDPEDMRVIYGLKRLFPKSIHYRVQAQFSKDGAVTQNISAVLDEGWHSRLKRALANAYAMTSLVEFEPLIDSTSTTFMSVISERFADTGEECPLHDWLQMYAFDIIGELTFSKQFGFVREGKDLDNMMHHTGAAMDYIGMVGQLPQVDYWFRIKNPLLRAVRPTGKVVQWTVKQIQNHIERHDAKCPDFLTKFVTASTKYPDMLPEPQLYEMVNTNIAAGSDTTAIVLRSMVYYFCTLPQVFAKFMDELKAVLQARGDSDEYERRITWKEGSNMKYLQACIKESLRCHPALGQLLPRVVPSGGVELRGKFLPEGTVVGCNAWTIHRDRSVFGEDADTFRPERWLNGPVEQIKKMEQSFFAFGAGTRVCIGRNIALLELSKVLPEFFRRFEIELVDPKRWRIIPGWVVPQRGLDVHITHRKQDVFKA